MNSRLTALILVAAALVIILVKAVQGQTPTTGETLIVIERANNVLEDTGTQVDSVGSIIAFANTLYDETNTHRIGNNSGFCVRTFVGQVWQCSVTFALATPGGQIMVEGAYYDSRDSTLAIVGGIDAYEGVRGQVTRHALDTDQYQYTFDIQR